MGQMMVQYKVHPGEAETNEALVRRVVEDLHRQRPSGFRYATFVRDDGVGFVHLAVVEPGAANPLPERAAFRAFQEGIAERCLEAPEAVGLREVGSFRFWGND
jgi:hypothetical protein